MGQAKRRAAEIEELKKNGVEDLVTIVAVMHDENVQQTNLCAFVMDMNECVRVYKNDNFSKADLLSAICATDWYSRGAMSRCISAITAYLAKTNAYNEFKQTGCSNDKQAYVMNFHRFNSNEYSCRIIHTIDKNNVKAFCAEHDKLYGASSANTYA